MPDLVTLIEASVDAVLTRQDQNYHVWFTLTAKQMAAARAAYLAIDMALVAYKTKVVSASFYSDKATILSAASYAGVV